MPGIHKMWRLPLSIPLFMAVILAASAIRAEETVDATDPQQVLAVVQIFGEAALGTDNHGDPKIEGRIEGGIPAVLLRLFQGPELQEPDFLGQLGWR
jgi:hypothetical protein